MKFENSIFEKEEIFAALLDGFNREFIKLMQDEGYDGIKYYGQGLVDPNVIKVIDLTRRKNYVIDDYGNLVNIGEPKDPVPLRDEEGNILKGVDNKPLMKFTSNLPTLTTGRGKHKIYRGADTQRTIQNAIDKYNSEGFDLEDTKGGIDVEDLDDIEGLGSEADLEGKGYTPTSYELAFQDALRKRGIDPGQGKPAYGIESDEGLLPDTEEAIKAEIEEYRRTGKHQYMPVLEDFTKDPRKQLTESKKEKGEYTTNVTIGIKEDLARLGFLKPEEGSDIQKQLDVSETDIDRAIEEIDEKQIPEQLA